MGSQELLEVEGDVSSLISKLEKCVIAEAWNTPPSLSDLRRTLDALIDKVSVASKLQRKLYPGPRAQNELPWWDPVAYNNAVLKEVHTAKSRLSQQELVPCWNVIHAAGTQKAVPLAEHSPEKFQYVWAPKAEACWTLHQLRALHP